MTPLSRSAFRTLLGRLDQDRFVAFVTELWQAREGEVRRDGQRLRVQDGGTVETVFVHHRPRWLSWRREGVPGDADVVVTNTPGRPTELTAGTRHVGPDELYEMVVYAIPRGRADTLCLRFLDRPVVAETDEPGDTDASAIRTATLVTVLCVSLVGAAVATVAGPGVGSLPGVGEPSTPTFGPPVEELPYSRIWPEDGRSSAGPASNACYEPAVDELPYTVMRPDRDGTGSETPMSEAGTPTPARTDCPG